LIVKTTFKSHFKIKKSLDKNKNKFIFIKNMVVFLLFSKIFFKGCAVKLLFNKTKKHQTNILKAPSRHKKFFHQVFFEFFSVKLILNFKLSKKIPYNSTVNLFFNLDNLFKKIGSNTFTRIKFNSTFNVCLGNYFKIN